MFSDNMTRTEAGEENKAKPEVPARGRELQYEAGDRVELVNGRKGNITWSYMSLFEHTYDIDLENGVFADQVPESLIKGKVEETDHDQELDEKTYELIENCGSEKHDYCCCTYETVQLQEPNGQILDTEIVVFECGCRAVVMGMVED